MKLRFRRSIGSLTIVRRISIYIYISRFLSFLLVFAVTNEISIKSPLLMASLPFLTRNKQKGRAVGQRVENSEWFHRRTLESEVSLSLPLALSRSRREKRKREKEERGEKKGKNP